MARVCLIEDDEAQRELRGLVLEAKGHTVVDMDGAPDLVLMDLRIPTLAAGLAKVRELKAAGGPKVVVLSGAVDEFRGTEEERMVDAILEKPCPSGLLLRTIAGLVCFLLMVSGAWAQPKDLKRHSPILYQRVDTIVAAGEEISDVPLLLYCEWDEKEQSLTYTVIFSNEDGGTSTRALMARWGRTTDIEYVYKVWLKPDGSAARRQIQTRDHQDVEFAGPFEGDQPVLVPVTRNNMVDGAGTPELKRGKRFDLEPVLLDLRGHAREYAMDLRPEIAKTAAAELRREGKLRPYGEVRGEDISDPANYAVIEMLATQEGGGRITAGLQLQGSAVMQMGHLGNPALTIERSGWMRTAIELPPGTRADQLAMVAFGCYGKGSCRLEKVKFVEVGGRRMEVRLAGPVMIEAGKLWFTTLK
jgi:CheY-like chemotaxis protein